jgi:hypothetical protein
MPKGITNKTGNAPIVRKGQTASGVYGDDPNFKGKVKRSIRDLNAK